MKILIISEPLMLLCVEGMVFNYARVLVCLLSFFS